MFRAFWGSRSETRRFKDGTIVESVVWSASNERIVEEIVRYAAGVHLLGCGDQGELVRCVSAQLEDALPANPEGGHATDGADALTRSAGSALDHLRKLVTSSLKGFPVSVDSLSASSPSLRYTSIFPPTPSLLLDPVKSEMKGQMGSVLLRPLHTVAVLSSGRWPAELIALRKTKTALIIRLSELLEEQFKVKSNVHEACLDVVVRGFVFRVHFYIPQELELCTSMQRETMQRNLVAAPFHHSIIHGLHARFKSYSSTVRLMHLWIESHMYTGHITNEAVELIVAAVYLENEEFPLSSTVGLLKALLKLSEHDWQRTPLIVDLLASDGGGGKALSAAEIESMRMEFDALREKSAMTVLPLFIISNATRDFEGSLFPCFTVETESVVLRLMMKSARKTAMELLDWMRHPQSDDTDFAAERILIADRKAIGCNVILSFEKEIIMNRDNFRLEANYGNRLWHAFLLGPPIAKLQLFSNLSSKERAFERQILM